MKKIIFVEKDESSYDPVAAFFNKKAPSVPKSLNSTAKPSNVKPTIDKKPISEIDKNPKPSTAKKEEEITPKIGMKGQYQPPSIPRPYPLKQEVLKSRDQSRTNVKKQTKAIVKKEEMPKIQSAKQLKQTIQRQKDDSIQKMKEQEIKPVKKDKVEASKLQSLTKRIKELQERQQQFQRKIEQLQAKEEKYVKNEQKLLKIQKDLKTAAQKSRQGEAAQQKLKQREAEIKQMLQGNTIPFNRKREVILNNKIKQLKRLNKELILRIKNYKGSDLVDLSVQQNREEITKDLYTVDVEKQLTAEMNAEMESLLTELINKLRSYLDCRLKEKGERMAWSAEQKFILEIAGLSEKISLNYLNNYDLAPIPKSNEEAASVYSILEEYKKSNQMKKAIDRFQLNFNLSKQNLELMQGLDSTSQERLKMKAQIGKPKGKREDQGKLREYLQIIEKRNSFLEVLLIQNICEMEYMKNWLEKTTAKISSQLASTSKHVLEIKNIVELGPSAKQSLFLYLQTNLERLSTRFSSLKYELKNTLVDFKWIQNCANSK